MSWGEITSADNTGQAIFRSMISPANTTNAKPTKASEEAYNVYLSTGDKGAIPRYAPYSVKTGEESIKLTTYQRSDYQKVMGKRRQRLLTGLLATDAYTKLLADRKAELLADIYGYAEAKAKKRSARN